MSYTKQTGVPCAPTETVVKLDDTGDLVAVQCTTRRDPLSNLTLFTPAARAIDASGAQRVDASGHAISTTIIHASSAAELAAVTADVLVRECLYLVLGEPLTESTATPGTTLLMASADNIAQCSIRNAIASASVTAPDASDVL